MMLLSDSWVIAFMACRNRGKSGLYETGWRVMPAEGDLRESAAENRLPRAIMAAGKR